MDERSFKDRLQGIFDQLLAMVGAARDAFNRHGLNNLQELQRLQGLALTEINAVIKEVDALLAQKAEKDKPSWLRSHSVLTHLHIVAENLGGLADPIHRKIKGTVLFSDKAVSQTNGLFDHQAGMLRSLMDIIKTNNDFLKRYTREEGQRMIKACLDYATEHEARLIEGVCTPQASPIFLAMLDRLGIIYRHESDIAALLSQ